MAFKFVRTVDEAVKILQELMKTPQLVSVHFEFDCDVKNAPMVTYEIKRFAFKEEEIMNE